MATGAERKRMWRKQNPEAYAAYERERARRRRAAQGGSYHDYERRWWIERAMSKANRGFLRHFNVDGLLERASSTSSPIIQNIARDVLGDTMQDIAEASRMAHWRKNKTLQDKIEHERLVEGWDNCTPEQRAMSHERQKGGGNAR